MPVLSQAFTADTKLIITCMQLCKHNNVKDGAFYCYCVYVLHMLRYLDFLWVICLLIQGYFCTVQNYVEKAELSKCSWYPKRKLGVTMHFSDIIKLQFGKERHTVLCILKLFTNIVD